MSNVRVGDILPAPVIEVPLTPDVNGYTLSEDDRERLAMMQRSLEARARDEVDARLAKLKEQSSGVADVKAMIERLKDNPRAIDDTMKRLETLHQGVTSAETGKYVNLDDINAREFLGTLRLLRGKTDATIEMAPGVHTHTIDLVIALIEGRP